MSLPRERKRPTRAGKTPYACVAILVLVGVVLAGCSGDGDKVTVPTSTTRARSSTSTTQDPVAAELVGRYKKFWDVRLEANREPVNPDDPSFGEYAIDPQLNQVVTETRQRRDQGFAIRRPQKSVYERRVKVVSVDDDTASLQDCATNDGIIYRVATGEVVDDKVVTRNLTATMRRVGGVWKLAETRVVQEWEGVAGCARSSDF